MKITLLRHGSRDLTIGSDGGLNESGREQAASLTTRLQPQGNLPPPTHLDCSPKRRARETLTPLSEHLGLKLNIEPLLDERQSSESSVEFRQRIRKFLESLREKYTSRDVVYLCTHADWLEEALAILPSDLSEFEAQSGFACGELKSFELKDGIWEYLK